MSPRQHWTLDSIPWSELRPGAVADSDELFYMVAGASFIETSSDLYTRSLVQHFADNAEVSEWLGQGWEPEELQHGRALREYVRQVWPAFDWESGYARFFAEYGALSKPELLLPERSLELVSRCVVEMSTASYYTALHHVSGEPVLAQLTRHIFEDEIGHYKYFYRFFRQYREADHTSRTQVLGALWHRLKMIADEDSYIALKHMYAARHPGRPYDKAVYKDLTTRIRKLAGRHVPHQMSVNMLLTPLDMPPLARRMAQPVVEGMSRRLMA